MPKFEKKTVWVDETGREWTDDERELEEVRERVLKKNPSTADQKKFKDLQVKVHEARAKKRTAEGRVEGVRVVATNENGEVA